ncbi:MAG: hypothetical protein ACYC5O_00570 [Anaerolineae bacterium]
MAAKTNDASNTAMNAFICGRAGRQVVTQPPLAVPSGNAGAGTGTAPKPQPEDMSTTIRRAAGVIR